MATVKESLTRMEGELRGMAAAMNEAQEYRAATHVQNLLTNLANTYTVVQQTDELEPSGRLGVTGRLRKCKGDEIPYEQEGNCLHHCVPRFGVPTYGQCSMPDPAVPGGRPRPGPRGLIEGSGEGVYNASS